jgi:hypothetical protein
VRAPMPALVLGRGDARGRELASVGDLACLTSQTLWSFGRCQRDCGLERRGLKVRQVPAGLWARAKGVKGVFGHSFTSLLKFYGRVTLL